MDEDFPMIRVTPHQGEIVARLAPDETHLEAILSSRLRHEITHRAEARVLDSMQLPTVLIPDKEEDIIIVTTEAKDESKVRSKKNRICIIIVVIVLLVVVGGGGLLYWLLAGDEKEGTITQESSRKVPTESPVLEPIASPTFSPVQLDPLLEELIPFIVETEEDLLVFRDPLSPQSQALAWLQDDPITMEPSRPIETVLERYALAVLYYSTSGPSWTTEYFMLQDEDVCEWNVQGNVGNASDSSSRFGVYCSNETGRVDYINLQDNNMEGTLPWKELSLLSDLYVLTLDYNGLAGPVLELRQLKSLGIFWAIANLFTGPLPEDVSPGFHELDLTENMMTGSIPASWATKISPITYIHLFSNALTGTILSGLALVPGLVALDVAENLMTGTIPTELGQVSTFTQFYFNGNSFTGNVEEIFCHKTDWIRLVADCEITPCSCCTFCCFPEEGYCDWA